MNPLTSFRTLRFVDCVIPYFQTYSYKIPLIPDATGGIGVSFLVYSYNILSNLYFIYRNSFRISIQIRQIYKEIYIGQDPYLIHLTSATVVTEVVPAITELLMHPVASVKLPAYLKYDKFTTILLA
jgi:hypothetical protein